MDAVKILQTDLEHSEIYLYGLSDQHLGSRFHDARARDRVIREIEKTPNAYILLLGDWMDNALKSSVGSTYEQIMNPHEQIREAAGILYPVRDRIIGVTEGNHEMRSFEEVGLLPMYLLCSKLELNLDRVYSMGAFLLFVGLKGTKHRREVFSIYCKHGAGGGGTIGSKANALNKMKDDIIADVYLCGHTHQNMAFPGKIYLADPNKKKLTEHRRLFVNTGSFLNWGGYAVDKGYAPTTTGAKPIHLWHERVYDGASDTIVKHAYTEIGY